MTTLIGALRRNGEGIDWRRLPGLLTMAAGIISIVSVMLLIQTSGVASVGYDIQRLEEVRNHWREVNYQLEHENAVVGDAGDVALLQPDVPIGADPGQDGDLFAA